jgi:hypothetical protein
MRTTIHQKQYTLPILACFLFLTAGSLQSGFTQTGINQGYLSANTTATSSAEAMAHASGEFRIVIANLLWINIIDHYHHQYMAQGHSWTTDVQLLPMLNLVMNLDPHFTQAYEVASAILLHVHRTKEGSDILARGAANNPANWQIEYDTAMMYAWFMKDPKDALPYAVRADALVDDSFDKHMLDRLISTLVRDCAAPGVH